MTASVPEYPDSFTVAIRSAPSERNKNKIGWYTNSSAWRSQRSSDLIKFRFELHSHACKPFLICSDLFFKLQRQPYIVQTLQQAFLSKRIDLKMSLETILVRHCLFSKIDIEDIASVVAGL